MTCPHPSRLKWRDETVHKATRYKNGSIDPILVDILRDGISRFHRNLELLTPGAYPPSYQALIDEQNSIGWDQLYRARWSLQWSLKQNEYSERHPVQPAVSGEDWIKGLGHIFLDQWFQVWTQRNEDRHGKDQQQHSILRKGILHLELHELYSYKYHTCPNDRHIFHNTAEDHITAQPALDTLENWIRTYRPVIMASVDQARRLGITRNHSIHSHPTNNPTVQPGERASLTAGSLPG